MPSFLKAYLLAFLLTLGIILGPSFITQPVFAQIKPATASACDSTFRDPLKPQCLQSLGVVFKNVLNVIMGLAGFVAFIFLIVGGFKFLTSQGDPKALGSARVTITWALGGLAMIIVSYLIILLISNYTGVAEIRQFNIPTPAP